MSEWMITTIDATRSMMISVGDNRLIKQQDENVSWRRESARKGLNLTSGAQFASLPLVKPVVWFARAVINWRSRSVATGTRIRKRPNKLIFCWFFVFIFQLCLSDPIHCCPLWKFVRDKLNECHSIYGHETFQHLMEYLDSAVAAQLGSFINR